MCENKSILCHQTRTFKMNNNRLTWSLVIMVIALTIQSCQTSGVFSLKSPDGLIEITVDGRNRRPFYSVTYKNELLIAPSVLGLKTNHGELVNAEIIDYSTSKVNDYWVPLFGTTNLISNNYKELNVTFRSETGLVTQISFRVYNDGVAFRYGFPEQTGFKRAIVQADHSEFRFTEDHLARVIGRNVENSDLDTIPLSKVTFSKPPALLKTSNAWVALNEASIFNFSHMFFSSQMGETTMRSDIDVSRVTFPFQSPWRVIMIGEKAGDLIESNILVNLNDPCKIKDSSWIIPGKSLWDWRNHGDLINGFTYGLNEASYKRLIDFASLNDIQYVLFDSEWYSIKGPQHPRPDLHMPSIIEYAREKNVKILLYLDRRYQGGVNDWDLEEVLKTFKEWGAAGIKYGFLTHEVDDRQTFVDTTRTIMRLCANYQMLVNFHDNPVHPGGEERTWPNRITVEYVHAQQDRRTSFSPSYAVTAPFVMGLNGALDMANGFFGLNTLQDREKVDKNGLNSTVAGETARCLVNYTPLLILPDNGDRYDQKADLFTFIREMPVTWDESRVLKGEPGEYIAVARRSGRKWFVGANTNEEPRHIEIALDFLENGDYHIVKYLDAEDTHYRNNKESYKIETVTGTKQDILRIYMAPGGGAALTINPI